MSKFLFSLINFLIFLLGVLIGPFFSNFFQQKIITKFYVARTPQIIKSEPIKKGLRMAELTQTQLDQIKKDFPDVVSGIISINGLETKIKTIDGKEYLLWPPQPPPIYTYMGVENNQKYEIQGKFLEENKLQWRIIK